MANMSENVPAPSSANQSFGTTPELHKAYQIMYVNSDKAHTVGTKTDEIASAND
jgi:hypothetical protein